MHQNICTFCGEPTFPPAQILCSASLCEHESLAMQLPDGAVNVFPICSLCGHGLMSLVIALEEIRGETFGENLFDELDDELDEEDFNNG